MMINADGGIFYNFNYFMIKIHAIDGVMGDRVKIFNGTKRRGVDSL